jgi:radical SAM protein with 4Fe4S-binding SPASM domain
METPTKVWLQTTASCNHRCVHCYGDCGPTPTADELTLDEWKALLDQLYEDGVISVFLEGGEPLHRNDIWDILRYVSRRFQVMLRTNATLLDAEAARELEQLSIGPVVVDLQGATAPTHELHYGVPGCFDSTLSGIRALRQASIPVIIACVLTRHNAGELQGLLDLAADLDVAKVGVLRLYPLGRARSNWSDLALALEEQMAAVKNLKAPDGVLLLESWHPHDGNCCWENAGVDARGRSIGCPYLRDFVDYGNVRTQRLVETWDHPLYQQLRSQDVHNGCATCHRMDGTKGGCRSTAYAFTGDWAAADPFCPETNEGIDLRVLPAWLQEGAGRPNPTHA